MALLNLPPDIDEQIILLNQQNPKLLVPAIVRDIVRIACILNLLREGILGEKTVVSGGMAMRCYASTRFTIYDTDTSAATMIDRQALARALEYADEDVRIMPAAPIEWDYGHQLFTAQPIKYEPLFTELPLGEMEKDFSLTVSHRGVFRPAQWRPIITGYPFSLGIDPNTKIPVMDLCEILAEKLVSWWLFGHAKHFADIAFIGALLKANDRIDDPDVRADVEELIDNKLEVNEELHKKKLQALTPDEMRRRLADPSSHIDPEHSWATVNYLGTKQFTSNQMRAAIEQTILPMLFGDSNAE